METKTNRTWTIISVILATILICTVVGLGTGWSSTSTKLDNTKTTLISTQGQLTSTQNQLTSTQANLTSTTSQLNSAQAQLVQIQGTLTSTQNQLSNTENSLTSVQNQLASTQVQLASANGSLASTLDKLNQANSVITTYAQKYPAKNFSSYSQLIAWMSQLTYPLNNWNSTINTALDRELQAAEDGYIWSVCWVPIGYGGATSAGYDEEAIVGNTLYIIDSSGTPIASGTVNP